MIKSAPPRETLKIAGLSALPGNSPIQHLFQPDYVTIRNGGNGALLTGNMSVTTGQTLQINALHQQSFWHF